MSTPPAFAQINPSGTESPFPGVIKGSGALTIELLNYTGTGEGTPKVVTFAKAPRALFFVDPTHTQNWIVVLSDGVNANAFTIATNGYSAATALMASATIDMDALNTAVGLTGFDSINKVSIVYHVSALEAN